MTFFKKEKYMKPILRIVELWHQSLLHTLEEEYIPSTHEQLQHWLKQYENLDQCTKEFQSVTESSSISKKDLEIWVSPHLKQLRVLLVDICLPSLQQLSTFQSHSFLYDKEQEFLDKFLYSSLMIYRMQKNFLKIQKQGTNSTHFLFDAKWYQYLKWFYWKQWFESFRNSIPLLSSKQKSIAWKPLFEFYHRFCYTLFLRRCINILEWLLHRFSK